MRLMYDANETFMSANGVSFTAAEVVRHLILEANKDSKQVDQQAIDGELSDLRSKNCEACDSYARDVLGINTGNRFCS